MGIYKRGKIWWLKFQVAGREIRMSTGCRSKIKALQVETRVRDQIAQGNWGIIERKPAPELGDFLKDGFLPWVDSNYENAHSRYNLHYGAKILMKSTLYGLRLNEITSEHIAALVDSCRNYSGSTINIILKTLSKALSVAVEWGKIAGRPTVKMVQSRKRSRVLTMDEEEAYLSHCREPWKTIAMLMLDCALRPEEAYALQWDSVDIGKKSVRVAQSKTAAGIRALVLSDRLISALRPAQQQTGYVFASRSKLNKTGHISFGYIFRQHQSAVKAAGIPYFEQYTLRHTCLTRMGEYTELPTLKVIAGHTSIMMTMRYVHPSQKSVEDAFKTQSSRYKSRHRGKFKLVSGEDKGK